MKSAKLNLFVLSIILAGAVFLLMSGKSKGVVCTHIPFSCSEDCYFQVDELRQFKPLAYPCSENLTVISIGGSCGRIWKYTGYDGGWVCSEPGQLMWNPQSSGDCDPPE